MPKLKTKVYKFKNPKAAMRFTLKAIGQAIKDSPTFFPLREWVASAASKAPRKNDLLQFRAVYNEIMKNWRYVRDPLGQETVHSSPESTYYLTLGKGVKNGFGFGDCDDITILVGSAGIILGYPVRLKVIAPPGKFKYPTHVLAQVGIPKVGWVDVDPVVEPKVDGFGFRAPYSLMELYNLNGQMIH